MLAIGNFGAWQFRLKESPGWDEAKIKKKERYRTCMYMYKPQGGRARWGIRIMFVTRQMTAKPGKQDKQASCKPNDHLIPLQPDLTSLGKVLCGESNASDLAQ